MDFKNINRNEIDIHDRLFYLNHKKETRLKGNTENIPYNPIWVQKITEKHFRIVDGFLTVDPLNKGNASQQEFSAFVFPEDYSIPKLWKKRIYKRLIEDNLTIIEFYKGLQRLLTHQHLTSSPEILKPLFDELNIKDTQIDLKKLAEIRDKSTQFKKFTDTDALGFHEINKMIALDINQLDELSSLFEGLQLKGKKLTSILNIINDLRKGYSINLSDLKTDKNILSIKENIPAHLRYKHIKQHLDSLRYPRLTELQNQWKNNLNHLKLSDNIKIVHDPFFEADEIQIMIKTSSVDGLKTSIDEISDKLNRIEFHQLFTLI